MSILHIVATPLGNLEDLSARAQRILNDADVLYAEDTRRTRSLLTHLGIQRSLESLHEHNERARIDAVVSHLAAGREVALVSDAGSPGVSDPGQSLTAAVRDAGFRVSPVVGPSALAAALSVCGFDTRNALFVGFLAPKGRVRSDAIARIAAHDGAIVLFESPHRVGKTLQALANAQPQREAVVLREMTKIHEEIRSGTLSELAEHYEDDVRGELTVVVGPWTEIESATDRAVHEALARCRGAGLSTRDAVSAVAAILERSRREVYAMAEHEEC